MIVWPPSSRVVNSALVGLSALLVGSVYAMEPFTGRPRQAGRLLVGAGAAGLVYAAGRWWLEDRADRESTRNPELMNAHFITGGAASAMSGDEDQIAALRVALAPTGRRRRRGNRVR